MANYVKIMILAVINREMLMEGAIENSIDGIITRIIHCILNLMKRDMIEEREGNMSGKKYTVFSILAAVSAAIILVFGSICPLLASQALQPVYVSMINKGNTVLFPAAAVYSYRILDKEGNSASPIH